MPKQKSSSSAKKRFKVTGTGKILRSRRHRTTPPGHLVKSRTGGRKRARRNESVAASDSTAVKKQLGRG
jgi:large subunit ribosomal protein L35